MEPTLLFLVYGLVVGIIAKLTYPGDDPYGIPGALILSILGSYLGGGINWILGEANVVPYYGSVMAVSGAILCCWLFDKHRLHSIIQSQQCELQCLKRSEKEQTL